MSKFIVKETLNYKKDDFFREFMKIAKNGFSKFDEKNPLGAKSKKVMKESKYGSIEMETEVTGFESGSMYETQTIFLSSVYKSRFEFNSIDENTLEVTLIEEQSIYGLMNNIGFLFQRIGAKKKLQEKLKSIVQLIENEIERKRQNIEKNKPKNENSEFEIENKEISEINKDYSKEDNY